MKKRMVRILSFLLALMMAIPVVLVAAETEQAADATESSGTLESNPAYKDGWLYLAYKNISTYSIVHSKNAKVTLKARCQELRADIEEWTSTSDYLEIDDSTDEGVAKKEQMYDESGAQLPVVDDASQLTLNEIIIGEVGKLGRDDLEAIAQANGIEQGTASFMIKVTEDGDVLVIGGQYSAAEVAVNYFTDRILEINRNERYVAIQKDYCYIYRHGTSTVNVVIDEQGTDELKFTLDAYSMNDVFCRLVYASNGAWRIQNKYSFVEPFDDIGAAQYVSTCLGEEPAIGKETLRYENPDENLLKVIAPDGSYAILHTDEFSLDFYTASGTLAQKITKLEYYNQYGSEASTIRFEIGENSPIYGTGGRFDDVNQYGKIVPIYCTNVEDSESNAYAAVPFFTRTNGTGLFINRNEYMIADIGLTNKKELSVVITSGLIDCYVITTEKISDAIDIYCSISGYASVPEDWTYGMLVCRADELGTKDKVYEMIAKMEEYNLPWNAIILESWNIYSTKTHANLTEICEYVHSLGKKVMVYAEVGNYAGANRDATYAMKYKNGGNANNLIPRNPNGAVQFDSTGAQTGYYLDLTNPSAVEWFFGEYWDMLMTDIGVDGIKLDYGEVLPDTVGEFVFYDADMKTAGTHQWYPGVFANLVWNAISSKPDGGMCYISGGGIGAQRVPYLWSGDQSLVYNRLQRQLTSILSAGLTGFAFTSTDIAGNFYKGGTELSIKKESAIFLRAVAMTAFTSSMESNGIIRSPYDYAEYTDKKGNHTYAYVTEAYKIYTMLHESLTPYLDEYSEIAAETGMPLVRHLILQYQNDENVYNIKNQFLLGDAFLVAPVVSDTKKRDIYLPEGTWVDLNNPDPDKNTYVVPAGGQTLKDYAVGATEIPVFYNVNNTSETAADVVDTVAALLQYVAAIDD